MRKLFAILLAVVASCSKAAPEPDAILASIKADDLRRHQVYLTSDELEGRAAGSPGGFKAAAYLEGECKRLGLKPAGKDAGFFFPFGDKGMKDVVAMWPGTDGNDEWIALAAHYDHLGRKDGEIYRGADDNASGTSVLLEVAEAAVMRRFHRSIVFFWFDGEELGLFGSKAWIAAPTLRVESCAAMLNIDMVGRNDPKQLIVCLEKDDAGQPKYPVWAAAIRESEAPFDVKFDWSSADYLIRRSDNWPFMERGVPAAFFTAGLHADYHKPQDTIDRIDFAKEERVGRVIYSIVARCADHAGQFR
jgi:hypothetical protein